MNNTDNQELIKELKDYYETLSLTVLSFEDWLELYIGCYKDKKQLTSRFIPV